MPRCSYPVSAVIVFGLLAGPLLPQNIVIDPAYLSPMLAPSADRDAQIVAFCSSVQPNGTHDSVWDVWLWNSLVDGAPRRLTNYAATGQSSGVSDLDLSPDGSKIAYVVSPSGSEAQIHVIDTASGSDHLLTTDTQGCVQPVAVCAGCYFSCVPQVRVTPEGGVLYVAERAQPLYVVSPSGVSTELPVYTASLANGPERVISDTGVLVFTTAMVSSATATTTAADVYSMNLDGSNLRNLTHFPSLNPNITGENATISADGSTIAFDAFYDLPSGTLTQFQNVFAVNADGSKLRQLTSGPDPSTNPTLSADGSAIAWLQNGQIQELQSAPGNSPFALTSYRYSTARDPMLTDDGSVVSYAIGPSNGGMGAIYEEPSAGGTPASVFAPVSLNPTGVIGIVGWVQPSPGSLFSVYGLNFNNDELESAVSFPLPTSLGGLSLLVNGQPVPLSSITPWQINAQLPQNLPVGNAAFQVARATFLFATVSNTANAQVQPTGAAAFDFTWQGYDQAAAFHAGTATLADAAHPVSAGEIIETYGTGLGLTNPAVAAGEPSPGSPLAYANVVPQVTLGSLPVKVTFAGLVPGLAGVYQVNLQVPQGLTSGPQYLAWSPAASSVLFVK